MGTGHGRHKQVVLTFSGIGPEFCFSLSLLCICSVCEHTIQARWVGVCALHSTMAWCAQLHLIKGSLIPPFLSTPQLCNHNLTVLVIICVDYVI
jgi:predicted membrane channel-forming protein YqfA (hemolysin III family)